jgi:pimeloyl-ACP methyl ester carboxylesterase
MSEIISRTNVMLGASGRRLAGVVVVAQDVGSRPTTLVCLPGASYGREYWDLQIPDTLTMSDESVEENSYSFAEFAATRGFVVVALEPLGVGESDHPADGPCTLEILTAAGSEALDDLRHRLSSGTLCRDLPAISDTPLVLIGHSTGAVLALSEQAHFSRYDALSLLGLNFVQMEQRLAVVASRTHSIASSVGEARIRSLYGSAWRGLDTIDKMDKNLMDLDFFHGPNGDPRLRNFDAAHSIPWPARPIVEGFDNIASLRKLASVIGVPLFLGYGEGELDGLPSPHANSTWFSKSMDVTLYVAPDSYHCHNFSRARHELWRRICEWVHAVTFYPSFIETPYRYFDQTGAFREERN